MQKTMCDRCWKQGLEVSQLTYEWPFETPHAKEAVTREALDEDGLVRGYEKIGEKPATLIAVLQFRFNVHLCESCCREAVAFVAEQQGLRLR